MCHKVGILLFRHFAVGVKVLLLVVAENLHCVVAIVALWRDVESYICTIYAVLYIKVDGSALCQRGLNHTPSNAGNHLTVVLRLVELHAISVNHRLLAGTNTGPSSACFTLEEYLVTLHVLLERDAVIFCTTLEVEHIVIKERLGCKQVVIKEIRQV